MSERAGAFFVTAEYWNNCWLVRVSFGAGNVHVLATDQRLPWALTAAEKKLDQLLIQRALSGADAS